MWLVQAIVAGERDEDAPLEVGWIPPALRIIIMLVAVVVEMPNRGWFPED